MEPQAPVRSASMRGAGHGRVVYPHSILPGGAWSQEDLAGKLSRDPVARQHYLSFLVSGAHVDRLDRSRRAYLSYRIGTAVYWTRKPVTLPEGEAVLSDGENLARARCGNRISFEPRRPTGPEVDLDTPEPPPAADALADADAPADFFPPPLLANEIFPPLVFAASAGPDPPVAAVDEIPAGQIARGFGNSGGGLAPSLRHDSEAVPPAATQQPPPNAAIPPALPLLATGGLPALLWTPPVSPPTDSPGGALSAGDSGSPPPFGPAGGLPPGATGQPGGGTHPGWNGPGGAPPDDPGDPGPPPPPPIPPPPVLPRPAVVPSGDDPGPETEVPEPATALLLGGALLTVAIRRAIG